MTDSPLPPDDERGSDPEPSRPAPAAESAPVTEVFPGTVAYPPVGYAPPPGYPTAPATAGPPPAAPWYAGPPGPPTAPPPPGVAAPPSPPHPEPAPAAGGPTWAKAALLVAVVGLLAVAGGILLSRAVDDRSAQSGPAPADTFDLVLDSCTTTASGTPVMTMRFTNRSGSTHRFRIRAGFFLGGRRVGLEHSVRTGTLEDGRAEELTMSGGPTPPAGFTCRITGVRFAGS